MPQRVLVTGGGAPLGAVFARLCLERGDRVAVTAARPDRIPLLADLAADHGDRLAIVPLDPDDDAAVPHALRAAGAHLGAIDLLVQAGFTEFADDALAARDANRTLATLDTGRLAGLVRRNATLPLLVVREALPLLRAGTAPRVLHVSHWLASIGARFDGGHYGIATSGAALAGGTRALALELAGDGIVVLLGHGGAYRTALHGPGFQRTADEVAAGLLAATEATAPGDTGRFIDWTGAEQPW